MVAAISQSVSPTVVCSPLRIPCRNTSGLIGPPAEQSEAEPRTPLVIAWFATATPMLIQLSSRLPTLRSPATSCPTAGSRSGVHISSPSPPYREHRSYVTSGRCTNTCSTAFPSPCTAPAMFRSISGYSASSSGVLITEHTLPPSFELRIARSRTVVIGDIRSRSNTLVRHAWSPRDSPFMNPITELVHCRPSWSSATAMSRNTGNWSHTIGSKPFWISPRQTQTTPLYTGVTPLNSTLATSSGKNRYVCANGPTRAL